LNFQSLENLYDETRTGGRVSLTKALGSDFLIGSVGYTLEDVGILFNGNVTRDPSPVPGGPPIPNPGKSIPQTLLDESGHALVSKFDFSLAYDTRNSVTLPNKGERTELTATIAGQFPGDKEYIKLELRSAWYFKGLLPGHVIELVGGTGVADAYGSTKDVPFYDRYYLGGLYSLRGFQYRGISPRENGSDSKEPIGGDTYWFGSAEYSIPIFQSEKERGVGMRLAAFYDIGNVMLNPYTYDFQNYNDNWGLGIRLNLPIGPLRLDYGIPIQHDKYNGSSGKFQFGVGYTRQF
jgi:outer membrane protein insertion porin family